MSELREAEQRLERPIAVLLVQLGGLVFTKDDKARATMEAHLGLTLRDAVDYLLYVHPWEEPAFASIVANRAVPEPDRIDKLLLHMLERPKVAPFQRKPN